MIYNLFLTFFKIGLFTFGGGYAMIASIREEVVQKREWLSDDELMSIITVAESTPGPIAINLATYVGYKKRGFLGAISATLGVVIPSFLIILLISQFLDSFMENKYVAYAFVGIKCAVSVLILRAGANLMKKMNKNPLGLITFGAVLALIIGFELFSISFSSIIFILFGGVIGIAFYGILGKGGAAK